MSSEFPQFPAAEKAPTNKAGGLIRQATTFGKDLHLERSQQAFCRKGQADIDATVLSDSISDPNVWGCLSSGKERETAPELKMLPPYRTFCCANVIYSAMWNVLLSAPFIWFSQQGTKSHSLV